MSGPTGMQSIFNDLYIAYVLEWLKQYEESRPDPDALERVVNEFMINFDKQQEAQRDAWSKAPVVDDDGFTVVRNSVKKRPAPLQTVDLYLSKNPKKKFASSDSKTIPSGTLEGFPDFYRFQHRQKNEERLRLVHKQFETDKKALNSLKHSRDFKKLGK